MGAFAAEARRSSAGVSEQRLRGAYFTPGPLAAALATWSVTRTTRRVLDPACGDGALLSAARERMRELRLTNITGRLYGVELDRETYRRARTALGLGPSQLRKADFFDTSLTDLGSEPFDAMIGNPPYVRHHLLDAEVKARAAEQARAAGITLNERADAWAYFCAHALTFLSDTGRLALLLPGSVLHADYALPLVDALGAGAGHSELIRIRERVFPEVLERTVLLLIDRTRRGAGEVAYREVDDVSGLRTALVTKRRKPRSRDRISQQPAPPADVATRARMRLAWHLTPEEVAAWQRVTALPGVTELGEIASLRIGVVTGANAFFVRTPDEIRNLSVDGRPIVARSGWLTELRWTEAHDARVARRRSRLMLVDPSADPSEALLAEIAAAEQKQIDRRYHCSKRERWYVLSDSEAPDLFLPYMSVTAPAAVINQARATCTNAIHRVVLEPGVEAEAVAVGSWTSLARVSAELFGRSYGGGVLKLELGEAARVRVPLVENSEGAAAAISNVLAGDGRTVAGPRARIAADRRVLIEGLHASEADVRLLAKAADRLERKRTAG